VYSWWNSAEDKSLNFVTPWTDVPKAFKRSASTKLARKFVKRKLYSSWDAYVLWYCGKTRNNKKRWADGMNGTNYNLPNCEGKENENTGAHTRTLVMNSSNMRWVSTAVGIANAEAATAANKIARRIVRWTGKGVIL
jgi:hypothetical protein